MAMMKEMNDEEVMDGVLEHLAEACCFAFELESRDGQALAFMVDSALKLAQVIKRGDDILYAAADYTAYEESIANVLGMKKQVGLVKKK